MEEGMFFRGADVLSFGRGFFLGVVEVFKCCFFGFCCFDCVVDRGKVVVVCKFLKIL